MLQIFKMNRDHSRAAEMKEIEEIDSRGRRRKFGSSKPGAGQRTVASSSCACTTRSGLRRNQSKGRFKEITQQLLSDKSAWPYLVNFIPTKASQLS